LDVVHEARLDIAQVIDNVFGDIREGHIPSARPDCGDSSNIGSRRTAVTTSSSATNVHNASLNRTTDTSEGAYWLVVTKPCAVS
jgi:hypothetical protein